MTNEAYTQNGNGNVPTSLWQSLYLRETLVRLVEGLIDRYTRNVTFQFTVAGVTLSLQLMASGTTTIAITYKDVPCPSPDPEPNRARSTATATPT